MQNSQNLDLIKTFESLVNMFPTERFNLEIIDKHAFKVSLKGERGQANTNLLLTAIVHGNEIGGFPALERSAISFSQSPVAGISVTFCLGNVEASLVNKRFIDRDLNRSFAVKDGKQAEHGLAIRLESIIDRMDYCIDFHQTVQPSERAFLIFPYNKKNIAVASSIAGENAMVTYKGNFSADGCTLDVYAESRNVVALTFEMGEIGNDADQAHQAERLFSRILKYIQGNGETKASSPDIFTFSDQKITSQGETQLRSGLKNFSRIGEGEVLAEGKFGKILAKEESYVLFPKYGELAKVSAELCRVIRPATNTELSKW